jgi:hypothetical protein
MRQIGCEACYRDYKPETATLKTVRIGSFGRLLDTKLDLCVYLTLSLLGFMQTTNQQIELLEQVIMTSSGLSADPIVEVAGPAIQDVDIFSVETTNLILY